MTLSVSHIIVGELYRILLHLYNICRHSFMHSSLKAPFFLCNFSEHCTPWPWGEFADMSIHSNSGSYFVCFPCVNNLSLYGTMDLKLFESGLVILPRLMSSNNYLSKIRSLLLSFLAGFVLTHRWMLRSSKLSKLLLLQKSSNLLMSNKTSALMLPF